MEAGTVAEAGVSAPDAVADSLEAALSAVSAAGEGIETVFVIGGASIYADAIQSPRCEALHVTELHAAPKCDTFFPEIDPAVFRLWSCAPTVLDGDQRITMKCYVRCAAAWPCDLKSDPASHAHSLLSGTRVCSAPTTDC